MVAKLLDSVSQVLTREDFGKLLLRLTVGELMSLYGLHKLFAGIDGISGMLIMKGFPGFIAYGALSGEVVAPCLIIPGILMRPAALGLAFTMVVMWLMIGVGEAWTPDRTGVWAIESLVYFFVGTLVVVFLGAGHYSVAGNSAWQ